MDKQSHLSLENQMERAVLETINDIVLMETQDRFCYCDKFRADVAALVLNQLKPRYATSFEGSILTLDAIQSDEDLQVGIRKSVMESLVKVAANPRCTDPECIFLAPKKADVELELVTDSGSLRRSL
jgi:competence protein ComFB